MSLPRQFLKWNALLTLFENMNTCYRGVYKLFLLDDAEDIEGILGVLNHICTIMTPEDRRFWKILVTSQRQPKASGYSKFSDSHFIAVSGFTFENAREFLKPCDLDVEAVEKIYETVGGNPLAMTICKSSIESYQVS